jgi:hypothetical protein
MGLQGQSPSFSNAVDLGFNGPTPELNNRPTLVISRSTAESPTKTISFAGGIGCLNFIAGVNAVLQTATMTSNAVYLFVNTQPGTVALQLDNGGSIAGQTTPYVLAFGAPVRFLFNGTNLS